MTTPDDQERYEPRGLEPSYANWTPIAHYYGDIVRQLFLAGAALMLLASPVYADSLSLQFPFIVFGAFVAVALAALTNPHKPFFLVADCVLAGVAVLIYATWGLAAYEDVDLVSFVLRLAIAVVFLFAFYFALKTVRAFSLNMVGKWSSYGEFKEPLTGDERDDTPSGDQLR